MTGRSYEVVAVCYFMSGLRGLGNNKTRFKTDRLNGLELKYLRNREREKGE